jgi:iron complex outermembrane receptor protein
MIRILPRYTSRIFPLTLLAASISASQASAQMVLEEVIVTANRTESNLMDTAAAVSSFDSSAMDERGIENQYDLASFTPSLNVAPSRVSIRGVGRPNLSLGSDPGVGLYWDGVYTTETDIFGYSNFLDIDRVEVLRGPQGTLYGRNSIGGAVNLISTKPDTEQWGGKVVGEIGDYDYWVVQGVATGPVTEKLSALVAASQITRDDGFQKNILNGDKYDDRDQSYWTVALAHQTTDRWHNSLKIASAEADENQNSSYILQPYRTEPVLEVLDQSDPSDQLNFVGAYPGTSFANPNQLMTKENPALRDEDKVAVDTKPWQKNTRDSATFISTFDLDSYTLKYTFGYTDFDFKRNEDGDGTNAADSGLDYSLLPMASLGGATVDQFTGFALTPSMITVPYKQENETWSNELQLISELDGRLNFMAGLYYYNSEETQKQTFIENNPELVANYTWLGTVLVGLGGGDPLPTNQDGILYKGEGYLDTTSYAAYGQAYWDWTDQTMLTVGLRYSYDEKDAKDNTYINWVIPEDPVSDTDTTVFREDDDDWNKVTWRVGIDHILSDSHFLYGFLASGYRSGGYGLLAPTTTDELSTVDPEEVVSLELGYKGSLLDERLNLATALYYYDYSDLQVVKQDAVNGVTVDTFENAADATAWGIETEVTALLTEGLVLTGTYSYNDTEYDEYDSADSSACVLGPYRVGNTADPLCNNQLDLSGNEFPLSPQHKASAFLRYMWELADLDWSTSVSYTYTSDQQTTAFNNSDYDELDSFDRWDARLNVASPELTWEATLWVQNISDDRNEINRPRPSPVSGLAASALSAPRTYGLKLSYNF